MEDLHTEGGPAGARSPCGVRALIYDFDDTIVHSGRINDALLPEFLRSQYGIVLDELEWKRLNGYSWSGVYAWLSKRHGLREAKDEVWSRFLSVKGGFLRQNRLRVASGIERMLALPVPRRLSAAPRGQRSA